MPVFGAKTFNVKYDKYNRPSEIIVEFYEYGRNVKQHGRKVFGNSHDVASAVNYWEVNGKFEGMMQDVESNR